MLSLISFTLRPGPSASQTAESTNETLTRTNSSNVTTTDSAILRLFQGTDLSELITNSFATAFTSNFKSSLNVTQESLEQIQLQVTSNITSALKSMLLLTLSNNNEDMLSPLDETTIHKLWYTDSPQDASSDYFAEAYNESVTSEDSTAKAVIINNIALPKLNNRDSWCVVRTAMLI